MVTSRSCWRSLAALLLLLCSLGLTAHAQTVTATAKVDSSTITVGDWLKITFEVLHPGNVVLGTAELPDSIPGFDMVKREMSPPSQQGDQTLEHGVLTVTAFDSGSFQFPSMRFPYTVGADTARRYASTQAITILVHGVAVDTSLAIKDIKPPLSLPMTFMEMLPYILGALLLAGLVWLFFYIRRKRKRGESIIPAAPPRPAHEVALEQLTALEAEHLWQRGMVKEFHSRVTEVVRQYVERRFGVMALEQTSDEVLASATILALPKETTAHLRSMLIRADLVKFAKFDPPKEEHEASIASAKAFVESTVERAEPPATEPKEVSA